MSIPPPYPTLLKGRYIPGCVVVVGVGVVVVGVVGVFLFRQVYKVSLK